MIIKKLADYSFDNSDFVTRNRAAIYLPHYVGFKKNEFIFECQGTQKKPYTTKVNVTSRLKVSSSCTCPYDKGGMCKHQIASVDVLIKLIKSKQILFDKLYANSILSKYTLPIPHKNRWVDRAKVRQFNFNHSRFYSGKLQVYKVEDKAIYAHYQDYINEYKLSYIYDSENDEILTNCNCDEYQLCSHKHLLLNKINKDFSLDIFVDNFEEAYKKDVLIQKNLLGKLEFDEAFTLSVSQDGIQINEKIANLIADPLQLLSPKSAALKKYNYMANKTDESLFKLAFCFEFYDGFLTNIYPVYGKLNKQKTAISSGLKSVSSDSVASVMRLLNATDASLLPRAIHVSNKFDELYNTHNNHESEAVNILEMHDSGFVQSFNTFIKHFSKHQLFSFDANNKFLCKNLVNLQLREAKLQPILKISSKGKFYQLQFKLKVDKDIYALNNFVLDISTLGLIIHQNELVLVKDPELLEVLIYYSRLAEVTIFNEGLDVLRTNILDQFSAVFELEFDLISEEKQPKRIAANQTEKVAEKVAEKQLEKVAEKQAEIRLQMYLSDADEGEYIVFEPIVTYHQKMVRPLSSEKIWVDEKALLSLKRDNELETDFLNFVQNLHPSFEERTGYFFISTEDALHDMWIMESIDKLKKEGIEVFGLNTLKKMKYNLNKPSFSIGLTSGTDWFDMEIDISFGNQKVNLQQLQKAILKNSNYVALTDGSLGLLPQAWIEKYKTYFKIGQVRKNKIEISNFQFSVIDELYNELETSPDFLAELYEKKKAIANLKALNDIPPSTYLKAKLRPYQQEGLNWMVFLHKNKLGGCLADDMGLGKTLQAIAFLQYLKDERNSEKVHLPSIVVVPTSLIFNWIAELDKFAPTLTKKAYIGAGREELQATIAEVDIILTTYGSLVRDVEYHKNKYYNYVILDESQAIKNPNSQRYKALRLLKANNRLALTGTPIENNTFDLYSQFNFLNPGIFGSIKHFRTQFSEHIDKEQDQEVSALLARMIHPFILRRTKTQVATELPDKTEAILYCEMEPQQQKVYDQFKEYFRQKLKEQIESEGVNKSQMYVLQGLTKLRQICNSTALASAEDDYGNYSIKLDELTRHIKEKVSNHKVLVFSQFVGMLELIKERLNNEQIIFEYLDGKTKNRAEKVRNFQENKDVRVFLISLKAGGTGLNLTEADYVYLVDPWWNPAVENQAIDRCYRIGQNKKVMAYRMICKNTIEEKIVDLQSKKKSVASDIIKTDAEKKSFNAKDIELLFS